MTDHNDNLNESSARGRLLSFLKHARCSRLQFSVLRFLGRHPKAKLSLDVIARAVRMPSKDLKDDIGTLVGKEILAGHRHGAAGITTYSLSADPQMRQYMDVLVGLEWSQAEALGRQLDEDQVVAVWQ